MIGTLNHVTTCMPVTQMVQRLLAPVVESPRNSCRKSRDSSISLLQPAMCTSTLMWCPVVVGHCEEFDPVLVHRAKMEERDFIDKMGVYDVAPRSDAAERGCCVIRTRWVTVNMGCQMIIPRYVPGGSLNNSVVVAVTKTSTSQRHLALVQALIAHAARWAEHEDVVVAVFDVRRAYFYAEEKRDTFFLISRLHAR